MVVFVDRVAGPYKERAEIAKYDNGRTPADGPPDSVVAMEAWFYADGTEILDNAYIAELEAKIAEEGHA